MDFDLEIEKTAEEIGRARAKRVLIQLPDGLKPKALEIKEKLEQLKKAKVYIWFGTNFGSCDLPEHIEKLKIDLLVSYGHSPM